MPFADAKPARARQPVFLTGIGLFLALVLPEIVVLLPPEFTRAHVGFAAREGLFWALAAIVLLSVPLGEKRPLASIGWRRSDWRSPSSISRAATWRATCSPIS